MSSSDVNRPLKELEALEALFEFYHAAGISGALSEQQEQWGLQGHSKPPEPLFSSLPSPSPSLFSPLPPTPISSVSQAQASSSFSHTVPGEESVMAAREAAEKVGSLEALRELMQNFEGCNLRFTAKNLVFLEGSPHAELLFIGEAPGREEDLEGRPFVGRSGQLLTRILTCIGLERSAVAITNLVPWRPPGNRAPSPQEIEICKPFLLRQITLIAPKKIVLLGGVAATHLLGVSQGILKTRGKWHKLRCALGEIPCLPTLHPAYLLREPLQKRLIWQDFLMLQAACENERQRSFSP